MKQSVLPFKIETMTLADIPAVVAIERVSYSLTWPTRAYEYELQHNQFAHYFVLRTSLRYPPPAPATAPDDTPGDQQSAAGGRPDQNGQPGESSFLIGLAGFWLMADEVHISTIAVHPNWRGLGLGEWLLLTLLKAGQALAAQVATLEVRPSNQTALALYQKYRFKEVGRRLRYYTDNDEDALIFTTPPLTSPDYQAMLSQRQVALFQRLAKIEEKQSQ